MYVNAPRYLLRKQCVLKLLKDIQTGTALDVGCGAGDMAHTLAQRGFSVLGVDYSEEAIALCRRLWSQDNTRFEAKDIKDLGEQFDLIIFMEVLEHIEDDAAALCQIRRLLNDGGRLILSVPAHQDKFGPSDRYVGHFRRYDKKDLMKILRQAGFDVEEIWSYGVPLANLTEWVRNVIYKNKSRGSMKEGTQKSGIDRSIESRFKFLLNSICLFPFYLLQRAFLNTDFGTGYILKVKKTV